jgi:hypothetical protein
MVSPTLVRYVLTAAIRDRLILVMFLMIASGAALATFMGSSALTEQESFSLVFGAAGLRFLGVFGVVLFCSFYMRRSFETKEVEFLLSRPISRMTFLFSHAAAFMILALMISCGVTVAAFFLGKPDVSGLIFWGGSLFIETSIMAGVALFFSLVLSSASGVALSALGFYVLTRMIGTLLGILSVAPENVIFQMLGYVLKVISAVVPRLDIMGQTSWLVYGVDGSGGIGMLRNAGAFAEMMMAQIGIGGFIWLQGIIFMLLLLAAAAFDFSRREF